jgi:DNA polymerase III epsilon subunit-like protein
MQYSLRHARFRVIDIETTGFNPDKDAVVEIAWAIMKGDGAVVSQGDALINPGFPIPPEASRVHGIYDDHVASAPRLDKVLHKYSELHTPALPAACHNAAFDSAFLRRLDSFAEGNPRFVCTLRLAENLLPTLSSYRLDAVVKSLGLLSETGSVVSHRAAADVTMTCSLLAHLIERYLGAGHEDDLEAFCQAARIQRMPFGKHKGTPLGRVPRDYLEWLLGRDIEDELRDAIVVALRGDVVASRPTQTRAGRKPWWWPF